MVYVMEKFNLFFELSIAFKMNGSDDDEGEKEEEKEAFLNGLKNCFIRMIDL